MLLLLACAAPPASVPPERPGPAGDPDTAGDTDPAGDTAPVDIVGDAPVGTPETARLCQMDLRCDVLPAIDTKVACTLRVATEDGRVEWDGAAEVWIRGRSSSRVVKPGYGVELAASADLLGMGAERDWVIDGLWYDRLLVRDKLGYDLLREMGNKAAESAFCELRINDGYMGVHALVERLERDDDRIDIADGAESGDAFVVKQNDEDCFYTNTTTYGCWKLLSPDDGALTEAGAAAMTDWFTRWERAIQAGEPVSRFVDVDAAVDAILIEELFKNEDAFYTSMHAWKDEGGTLRFVPWDLDMTFGQFPGYNDYDNPHAWIQFRPRLWTAMAEDPVVQARLAARWAELRAGLLTEEALYARIDALQAILGPAIDRNFERWPIDQIQYNGWFYPVSSYEDEEAYVRAWIAERLPWMDANIGAW